MTDSIAAWVINLIATYPTLIVWILGAYFVASFVVNFLRGAYGKVEAKLVAATEPELPKKHIGLLAGKLTIPDDFDAPLPDELLKAFEGDAA